MAEAAAGTAPRDVELSDQGGEQRYDKIESKKEEKPALPDFFPSHGLTTAGNKQIKQAQTASGRSATLVPCSPCFDAPALQRRTSCVQSGD